MSKQRAEQIFYIVLGVCFFAVVGTILYGLYLAVVVID